MSLLAKKKSNFQSQKQWSQKFHIKFRNTGTPPPYLGNIPKKFFFTASLSIHILSVIYSPEPDIFLTWFIKMIHSWYASEAKHIKVYYWKYAIPDSFRYQIHYRKNSVLHCFENKQIVTSSWWKLNGWSGLQSASWQYSSVLQRRVSHFDE